MIERIGTAGQPAPAQLADIAAAGCATAINPAMHDSDNVLREEGSIVGSPGIDDLRSPVPFEVPSAEYLGDFIRIVQACDGDKVLVLCAINAQVSAFGHQYATLKKGIPSHQATSPVLRYWRSNVNVAWRSIVEPESRDLENDGGSHPL